MEIKIVTQYKEQFLDLLLLADEQLSMIEQYLQRGTMFVLYDKNIAVSICVVTKESYGYEIKNMVTRVDFQRKGYGKKLLEHIFDVYGKIGNILFVGTGESIATMSFYESCGFVFSHKVKNFFIEHYDHPIIEEGVQLVDMIYFKKEFST